MKDLRRGRAAKEGVRGRADARQVPLRRLGGRGVLRGVWRGSVKRRGGGEDPWLCGPGFRRVCLCRGE
jgi:hypothetical protein